VKREERERQREHSGGMTQGTALPARIQPLGATESSHPLPKPSHPALFWDAARESGTYLRSGFA